MAKRVVDVLEMVEVEVMHGELIGAAPGARELQIEPFEKRCAVRKAGKRIGSRQRCDLLCRDLAVGNVGEDALDGDQPVFAVTQRAAVAVEPHDRTVGLAHTEFLLIGIHLALADRPDIVDHGGQVGGVDDCAQRSGWANSSSAW